jgi:hypothetical protein
MYLFIGVQKFGENWQNIFDEFKSYFEEACTVRHLKYRYSSLKKQTDLFNYFQKKASLEVQNENLN